VAELTERIARMREAEVTRLATEYLQDPDDLGLFGMLPAALDDGMVDPQKGKGAAEELIAVRPGLARGARVPSQGFAQGRRAHVDQGSGATWGAVLRGHD
jgi:hypothetical protein